MLASSKFKGCETLEEKGSAFKALENYLKDNSRYIYLFFRVPEQM
jgi:hypothetical protein